MKNKRHGRNKIGRPVGMATILCLLPITAGALDIADFLACDQGNCPNLTGTGYYLNGEVAVDGLAKTDDTGFVLALYSPEAVVGRRPDMVVDVRLEWELTDTQFLLHATEMYVRSGYAYHDKYINHGSPVCVLPREFQLGKTYDCILEDGSNTAVGQTKVGEVSVVSSNHGQSAEVIQLVLFVDEDVSIILYLARDIGVMKAKVVSTYPSSRNNLRVDVSLDDLEDGWHADPVESMWCQTHRDGEGWRSSDWTGKFWTYCTDSPWICHTGLGWLYCSGGTDGLYAHVDGGGWLWTKRGLYPVFYSFKRGEYIYYVDVPGSNVIWDYGHGRWDILVD
jgi:hypothetical protein